MANAAGLLFLIGLTGWVARDAARRGQSWAGWSAGVFFTGALAILAWLVVRRSSAVTVERLGLVRGTLLSFVGVPLLVLTFPTYVFVITFLFQVARVQGQSMAPTLQSGDRVLVNKLAYRMGEPRRGDIVMFHYPLRPERSFVQRVLGEEGDMVRIVDGRVFVNDQPLKDDYVPDAFRSHDDWGSQVIPEGYYFVMGDHRNNSSDSRHWGFVPKKYILGKIAEPRHR